MVHTTGTELEIIGFTYYRILHRLGACGGKHEAEAEAEAAAEAAAA
jgi:hypothetical protein